GCRAGLLRTVSCGWQTSAAPSGSDGISGRVAPRLERGRGHPHPMECGAHPHRQFYDGERAILEPARIENREITAILCDAIHEREQIAFTLGRTGAHDEVRFLHAARAGLPRSERALGMIETADGAHAHLPGARRGRTADRVAKSVRLADVA